MSFSGRASDVSGWGARRNAPAIAWDFGQRCHAAGRLRRYGSRGLERNRMTQRSGDLHAHPPMRCHWGPPPPIARQHGLQKRP